MKAIALFLLCLTFIFSRVDAYDRNPYVDQEVWDQVSPFFLPENHPIKDKLDKIFKKRVSLTEEKLKRNGFRTHMQGDWSHMIVAKHHKIEGYLFKIYTDKENISFQPWQKWLERIEGARIAQEIIENHSLNHVFKVPKKWVYPLPPEPSPSSKFDRKNFILVVEDMDVYSDYKNKKLWKSKAVTKHLLDALYILLAEGGFADNIYAFNLPFSKDGKIAFIDTELHSSWPVPFDTLSSYMPSTLRRYWRELTK